MRNKDEDRATLQRAIDDGWYADADDRDTLHAGLGYLEEHWEQAEIDEGDTALAIAEALCLAYQES